MFGTDTFDLAVDNFSLSLYLHHFSIAKFKHNHCHTKGLCCEHLHFGLYCPIKKRKEKRAFCIPFTGLAVFFFFSRTLAVSFVLHF